MSMQSVPVTDDTAKIAGEYISLFRRSHGLTIPDAIIAATAKFAKADLVTSNVKHFPMKDINVVKPY